MKILGQDQVPDVIATHEVRRPEHVPRDREGCVPKRARRPGSASGRSTGLFHAPAGLQPTANRRTGHNRKQATPEYGDAALERARPRGGSSPASRCRPTR